MKPVNLIISVVAIIAAIAAGALLFITKGELKETSASLSQSQATLQSAQAELSTANANISELETKVSQLTKNVSQKEQQVSSLNAEVFTAEQQIKSTQNELREAQSEVARIEQDLRKVRSQLISVQAEEQSETGMIAQLNERVAELETANQELEDTVATTKQALMQANAGRSNRPTTSTTSSTSEYTFPAGLIGPQVTIASILSKDGVFTISDPASVGLAPGQTYKLIKDLSYLADIKVTEIKDGLAIAHIQPGSKVKTLTAGLTANLLR